MPRNPRHLLFVGIYHSVAALDTRNGEEVWRTKIGGMTFVNVLFDGVELFATTKGEAFRLDPQTGALVWQSKLPGLGRGTATLASTRAPTGGAGATAAESVRRATPGQTA